MGALPSLGLKIRWKRIKRLRKTSEAVDRLSNLSLLRGEDG
jgi:hypothetical protein